MLKTVTTHIQLNQALRFIAKTALEPSNTSALFISLDIKIWINGKERNDSYCILVMKPGDHWLVGYLKSNPDKNYTGKYTKAYYEYGGLANAFNFLNYNRGTEIESVDIKGTKMVAGEASNYRSSEDKFMFNQTV